MVYKFPQLVQYGNFSCVEELRCDAIENLLRIPENIAFSNVNFLVTPNVGRKLYTELLKSDVNGFSLSLFGEETNEEVTDIMTKQSFVVISVNNQGTIFVEEIIYIEPEWANDFWYVQKELYDDIKEKIEKCNTKTLVFTIS